MKKQKPKVYSNPYINFKGTLTTELICLLEKLKFCQSLS